MANTTNRSLRRATAAVTLAAAAFAGGVASTTAAAASAPAPPAVGGMTFAYAPFVDTPDRDVPAQLTITLTSAHSLKVSCSSGNRIVVNTKTSGYPCSTLGALAVKGTSAADAVDVSLPIVARIHVRTDLGAGNDTATVVASQPSELFGESGNDKLTIRLALPNGYAGLDDQPTTLSGGAGNDTLNNLGYTGPGHPPAGTPGVDYPIEFWGATLDGGAGADTVYGNDVRPDLVVADTTDRLVLSGGPGRVKLTATSGTDRIVVGNNGNYGTKVSVTTSGATTTYDLPTLTSVLQIDGGAGNDTIVVGHRSKRTEQWIEGGAGADALTVNPSVADWSWDAHGVYQPGWASLSYGVTVESTTVTPILRP